MENQVDKSSPVMNEWAGTSRLLGICSLLPYLIWGIMNYLGKNLDEQFYVISFLLTLLCVLWGIIFGPAGLITGIVGTWQIHKSQGMETGTRVAILGIIIGIIGTIANVLFVRLLLVWFVN